MIRKKICFVITVEFVVTAFLLNHLRALSALYDVTVIVNTNNPNFLTERGVNVKVIPLLIARDIHLYFDFFALLKLIFLFRKHRYNAVHSVTPKAGLLAMLASWVVRVPLRFHTFTGQVWANKTGLKRAFLKQFDVLIARLATVNIVDSPSQRQFLLNENVLNFKKTVVFGEGSISGVDLERFKPNPLARLAIRQQLQVADDAFIFLFLGRLAQDKGVLDLAQAFSQLNVPNAHLLFVGPDEQGMKSKIESITLANASFIHFVGYTTSPEEYMAAADVFCLPSYREGFGSVLIEAAAVGIPSIASRIYGITDAVIESETGLLHTPKNINEILACMDSMVKNTSLRLRLAERAKARATDMFDSHLIANAWVVFYQKSFTFI